MSMLFRNYHEDQDDNYSGMMASRMRSSIEEDWTPSTKAKPNRRFRKERQVKRARKECYE